MFNPTIHLIDAFIDILRHEYLQTYSNLEPDYPGILTWAGRMALETIATSDALYHNVEHTIMVTLVGQEILKGKHLRTGGVTPYDWLHFLLSLLCHDIGYVKNLWHDDANGSHNTGHTGEIITLPEGATDASLAPYHVDRGKRFIRKRFLDHAIIDPMLIASNIERTRFPVPDKSDHHNTSDYPGLVRAADLIGQLADPHYLQKFPALFYEFEEIGMNTKLGYRSPSDLRTDYPAFYWSHVSPYIQDALRYLSITQAGQQWIAHLYAHVFAVEHQQPMSGEFAVIPL